MWLNRIFSEWISTDFMSTLIKILSAVAFVLILILLINQITRGELKNAMTRRKNRTLLDLRKEGRMSSDHQLEQLLKHAITKRQYGQAVRYLYQNSLLLLRNDELIQWKADKTNHEYLNELGDHPVSAPFDRLTYIYEYVDYGDFQINERQFKVIYEVFNDFKQKLGSET